VYSLSVIRSRLFVLATLIGLVGCERPPIVWDAVALPVEGIATGGVGAVLVPSAVAGGAPRLVVPSTRGVPRAEAGLCVASLRLADGADSIVYAAWWTARPDSSVALRVARSGDGGAAWGAPETADDRDRGVRGCARPAPAVTIDPDSGYVHVAYYFEPAEGAGVFYVHRMQGMFHAPVAIVYGQKPAAVAVGARGDTVVVAYEDPNGATPRVVVALSLSAGHLFTFRTPVSGEGVAARAPVVGVRGTWVGVGWWESAVGDADAPIDPTDAPPGRPTARVGTIR
jgi:hypothetical protein